MSSIQEVLTHCGEGVKAAAITTRDATVSAVNWLGRSVAKIGSAVVNFAVNTYNWAKPFFTETVFPFIKTNAIRAKDFVWANRNYIAAGIAGAAVFGLIYTIYQKNNAKAA